MEGLIGEHVTDAAETITSSLIFVAWLLSETKQIKLGSGTVNMPNNHPARIAAEVAMVDHMAKGRFIFGISPGGLLSDAEVFGNLDRDRTAMFLESINHVLAIWSGEPPYNIKGEFWNISTERTLIADIGQGTIAKPFQKPHPPIVVTAVAPFSKGVTEAAARGWEPISANFLLPLWVKSHWPKYVEGCEKGGRPPTRRTGASPRACSLPMTSRRQSATRRRPRGRIPATTTAGTKLVEERPLQSVQGRSEGARFHRHYGIALSTSSSSGARPRRWWTTCSPSATRSAISARCSMPAMTGRTSGSRGDRWSSWPKR